MEPTHVGCYKAASEEKKEFEPTDVGLPPISRSIEHQLDLSQEREDGAD